MKLIKDTLNMPKTSFEMKANLPLKEPIIRQKWIANDIYKKVLENNRNNKEFILHDGPPYANGDIHLGHALNKILKDFIVRHANFTGKHAPLICGWDTHGLPIEHALAKKLGPKYKELRAVDKRVECAAFAQKWIDHQKDQFSQLGIFTDWNNYYATFDKNFEKNQLELFKQLIDKGLVFTELKPVLWSPSSLTALAEAEVEYRDLEANSIFVTFDVVDGKDLLEKGDQIIIWTTTPWTIPSNLAIAVHPEHEYCIVKANKQRYVVAKKLAKTFFEKININEFEIIKSFKGSDLDRITYQHNLYHSKTNQIILAEYVLIENGTGLVHCASGFGEDDYYACKAYGIDVFCPIDQYGKFTSEINDQELVGVFYEKANDIILDRLNENGHLLLAEKFTHSAACDWRTKKPVIYRATKQWFVNIKSVREQMLSAIQNVQFNLESNKKTLQNMIDNRYEWCISRQRIWGIPIPMILEKETLKPVFDKNVIDHVFKTLLDEGTNAWYEKPVEHFLPSNLANKKDSYTKETDTMDVWFDSGTSHLLIKKAGLSYPCDLYVEGNDQYRGWFNSSLITSVIVNGFSPYKRLLSHGFVVDEQKRKMSKSLGNGGCPIKSSKEFGTDIVRMWVANSDYSNDVSFSQNILKQISEVYRRIRNSLFKFVLGNLNDFYYDKNKNFEFDELSLYVLNELKENIKKINNAYDNYSYVSIIKTVNNHVIKLSSVYFDIVKDSLYCDEINNKKRRMYQTVLFSILKTYMILLSPIIPHTCEELYECFENLKDKKESIFMEKWIYDLDFEIKKVDVEKWRAIFELKNLVFNQLEKARNEKIINKNNEADIVLEFENKFLLSSEFLKELFNCSTVTIKNSNHVNVVVAKTTKIKCERCWNYFNSNNISKINEISLCERCYEFLKK